QRARERRRDAARVRGEGHGADARRRLLHALAQGRELQAAEGGQEVGVRIAEAELAEELAVERDAGARREDVERRAVEGATRGVETPGHPEEVERDADAVELDREAALVGEGGEAAVVARLERKQHARRGIDHGAVLALGEARAD